MPCIITIITNSHLCPRKSSKITILDNAFDCNDFWICNTNRKSKASLLSSHCIIVEVYISFLYSGDLVFECPSDIFLTAEVVFYPSSSEYFLITNIHLLHLLIANVYFFYSCGSDVDWHIYLSLSIKACAL
nr:MAG TPA: hypothetical protein [Caudoviricetes sp.]